MADGLPPRPDAGTDGDEPTPQQPASPTEPAPLDAIRVKGPGARGLNKPAILTAAGGGVAVVLLLASGAFSSNPSAKPATTKPMMSDPARPEMAQGAIKALPADYAQAAALEAQQSNQMPVPFEQAGPPQLGPPLPGMWRRLRRRSSRRATWRVMAMTGVRPQHTHRLRRRILRSRKLLKLTGRGFSSPYARNRATRTRRQRSRSPIRRRRALPSPLWRIRTAINQQALRATTACCSRVRSFLRAWSRT